MPNKTFGGINLRLMPDEELQFDYTQSDVRAVYRRGLWHSWNDIVSWIERDGTRDNELTPGEAVALVEDARTLAQNNTRFTSDPRHAYQELHKQRDANAHKHVSLYRRIDQAANRMAA